jgi:hypothetical protein
MSYITRAIFQHTAVIERNDGSVDVSGNLLTAASARWDVQGTIDCRYLSSNAVGGGDDQQANEQAGQSRQMIRQVYAPVSADVRFGDRLVTIATKPTGGTVGGTVWGTPYTVIETGPLYVIGVGETIDRSAKVKVLEVERVI